MTCFKSFTGLPVREFQKKKEKKDNQIFSVKT